MDNQDRLRKLLQPLKNDINIAISNINQVNSEGVKNLLALSDANIRIVGGWNQDAAVEPISIDGEQIPVHSCMKEFIEKQSEVVQLNTIIFLPEDSRMIEELESTSLDKIQTVLIVWGYKSKVAFDKMKKIATICAKSKTRIITIQANLLGYDIGYMLEDVKNMPWTINSLDKDVSEYLQQNDLNQGTFLDLGTGSGTQAVQLNRMGFTVTATDMVKYAFQETALKEKEIEFLEDNLLESKLNKKFDYILDRGCLHAIGKKNYDTYVTQMRKLMKDDSILFLKYATNENGHLPDDVLEFYLSEEELYRFLHENFTVVSSKETIYEQSIDAQPLRAIFAILMVK